MAPVLAETVSFERLGLIQRRKQEEGLSFTLFSLLCCIFTDRLDDEKQVCCSECERFVVSFF